jgi:hypothetical protein
MRTTLAGFAAVSILAVAGAHPATAMPIAPMTDQAQAAHSNITSVQYRRHYRRNYVRHYRYGRPRYGYVGPGPYYGWGYPYRYYPYPYNYSYGYGPGVGVRIGPFGFGIW